YGLETTLAVSLDMMINHGAAVVRGSERACVIVDMPFGSYQESAEQAYRNAARVMQETGCDGVKLEAGVAMASTIEFLSQRGIPVMGHVGLMPQSVHTYGGFRVQGKDTAVARQVIDDARAVADAGAFSMVVEGVMEPVAREITQVVSVPTIGIGASADCDGQVLVTEDLVGMFSDFTPKFVKRYAELGAELSKAAAAYADDVRARRFPSAEYCFGAPKADGAEVRQLKP
ncbi:MAG: 3-methyl-2-oxobutanoate hydroxymethyltransferase, partial [Alphaproteobacteria bacterium]